MIAFLGRFAARVRVRVSSGRRRNTRTAFSCRELLGEHLESRHLLATLSGVAFDDSVLDDEAYTAGEEHAGLTITATDQSNGQQYSATTGGAGTYSLQVPNGTYLMSASGSSLANDIVLNDFAVSSANVSLDFDTSEPGEFIRTMVDPWVPNPVYGTTFRSSLNGGSGFWDDPTSWSTGRVPTANDRVIVQAGDEVVVRNTNAIAKQIGVYDGGKLRFATGVNTELQVVTLLVLGELEIGTASTPITSNVTATVTFRDVPIDLNFDPGQYGNGLLALGSAKVRVHGATKAETFIRLAQEPTAGNNTLVLSQSPTGWRVGDKLAIPDTRQLQEQQKPGGGGYDAQWEELTIAGINGNVITLSSPLQFDHPGARDGDGHLDFLPHIMNRTRNVVFRSANPDGTRGHTLFQGRSDIDVRYAAFAHLGRTRNVVLDNTTFDNYGHATHRGTNQIARYPVHAHHLIGPTSPQANGYQYSLVGNSVDSGSAIHDRKWAITIHGSHYGLIAHNTVYNVAGSAVVTEDGTESYNVFEKNMVLRAYSYGDESRYSIEGNLHTAREATGFWFRGPLNYVRDNVATNIVQYGKPITAYGFKYMMRQLRTQTVPAFQGAMPMTNGTQLDLNETPLVEFNNNEAYGAMEGGLTYWWLGANSNQTLNVTGTTVIKDFKVWHTYNVGIYAYQSNRVTIDGLTIRGFDPNSSACCTIGWHPGDYVQKDLVIKKADIQGMRRGIDLPEYGEGLAIVENSYLRNSVDNIRVRTHFSTITNLNFPAKSAEIRNVRFDSWGNNTVDINMHYFPRDKTNLIQDDDVYVYNYNGVAGDDFRVYYLEQAPDFIVPQTDSLPGLIGSPVAGLTNAQNMAQHGIAIAGSVSPTQQQRAKIHGYVASLNANNPPLAAPDTRSITEDGANPVSGNVLTNDTDADGDSLAVNLVDGNASNVGASVAGAYGSVVINSNGSYSYTLDNSNLIVQALDAGQTLTDSFTYAASDGSAASSSSLTITIQGADDNSAPVAVNDATSITEDGTNPVSGNVLSNDSDADGDTLTVSRVEGVAGNVGATLNGSYGTIRINANGTFQYTLDNSNPAVNGLDSGETLSESFDYTVTDGRAASNGRLTLTIQGNTDVVNRPPVAVADSKSITEDGANPVSGNVLSNDSDPDGDALTVVRVNGASANVGQSLAGSYGTLVLRSDGSYDYTLDNANPTVNGLSDGQTLTETFNYQVADTQLQDASTLTVTIRGTTDGAAAVGTDLLAVSGSRLVVGLSTGTSFGHQIVGNWSNQVIWSDFGSGDVNGDGVDDVIARAPNGDWWVGIGGVNGFVNAKWGQWSSDAQWEDVALADVTGDGLTDIVGRAGGVWWVARSTGNRFVNERWGQWSTKVNWQHVMMADVNGDARSDIVGQAAQNGTWWASLSTGTQFTNQLMGRWAKRLKWTDVRMADVNGDGRDDLLGRAGGTWWVGRSTGTEFINEQWGAWSARARWEDVRIADVDGDGRADVVGRAGGDWWVARSNGQRFVNEKWGTWSTAVDWQYVRAADFNGDGRDDIVGYVNGKWWVSRSDSNRFANELWANWSDHLSDVLTGEFPEGTAS